MWSFDKAHKIIDSSSCYHTNVKFTVCSDVQCYVLSLPYNWKGGTSDVGKIFWNEYKHQSKILEIPNSKHQYLMFS